MNEGMTYVAGQVWRQLSDDEVSAVIAQDAKRRAARERRANYYDQLRGYGCSGRRVTAESPIPGHGKVRVPAEMTKDPGYAEACRSVTAWERLRCRYDFEFWCARCVKIRHKLTGQDVEFILNRPQQRLVSLLEKERAAGRPQRIIMLKARQWGGSTVVQIYMAWIQMCRKRNWHSLICAHVKDTSAVIRGMYSKLLSHYPEELWEEDKAPEFKPFDRSVNIREMSGRGCRVTIGSSEKQDSLRGLDVSLAHLSEVAFWPTSAQHDPADVVRSVSSGIAMEPETLVVIESTANGVGNYFHTEWCRAERGESDKTAFFVPWYEIGFYVCALNDKASFIRSMNAYEWNLWDNHGVTLDALAWYRQKCRECQSHDKMAAEFPSTAAEAFANTGNNVFAREHVERMRESCTDAKTRGEVSSGGKGFEADSRGCLQVWEFPQAEDMYVVGMDIGGRSEGADWSVISVIRAAHRKRPAALVAQWRGHTDHDILGRKCCDIGRYYNEALIVVESNTLESEVSYGSSNLGVLNVMAQEYDNLYRRETFDSVSGSMSSRVGFHTNRSTKAMLVDMLIEAVREGSYVERDFRACDEYAVYEQSSNGSYGARRGFHDDIVMSRAMALHGLSVLPERTDLNGLRRPQGWW